MAQAAGQSGATEQRHDPEETDAHRFLAGEQVEELAHRQARHLQAEKEHDHGHDIEEVDPRPVAHGLEDGPPGLHSSTSDMPVLSSWAKRDDGSAASAARGPHSSTRPSSRIRMSSAR